jgi:hypothetical protein
MIDDYARSKALVRKMEAHLPLPVRASNALARLARQKNLPIARNQELPIKRVFYAGDEGGILRRDAGRRGKSGSDLLAHAS